MSSSSSEFAKLKHEKIQLKFESKMSELGKSASKSAAKMSSCKQPLSLDLTVESGSNDSDTKIFIPPRACATK